MTKAADNGPAPLFWSVRRLAQRWDCSKGRVYTLINGAKGEPPRLASVRFDGSVRVPHEAVLEFEREHISWRSMTSIDSAGTEEDGLQLSVAEKLSGAARLQRILAGTRSARSAS